jgi:hypothetical protein
VVSPTREQVLGAPITRIGHSNYSKPEFVIDGIGPASFRSHFVLLDSGLVLDLSTAEHKELTGPRASARIMMFVTDREFDRWNECDWQFVSDFDDGSESPVILRMTPAHQTSGLDGFFPRLKNEAQVSPRWANVIGDSANTASLRWCSVAFPEPRRLSSVGKIPRWQGYHIRR